MSEYIITKRTECKHPKEPNTTGVVMDNAGNIYNCRWCFDTGFVKERVDADEWLLSRLAKLRWDEKWGEHTGTTKEMGNPRFEGDER